LATEFAVNNKVHSATKILPFMANYGRELRMGANIRRKGKVEKVIEFAERMRRVQEEVEAALKKAQEEMKWQADKERREVETWRKRDKVILSTKDSVFRERLTKKLTERYVGPYVIEEVVSKNIVKLRLPTSIRIYLVVNMSRVVRYGEPGKEQRVEKLELVEVDGVEEWEVEKILNKRKIWEVEKYLVCWKGFIAENDIWKKEENLENTRELVDEFEERISTEVRRQEGIDEKWKIKLSPNAEEFRRSKLPGKYIVKILFGWNDKKFEDEYLKKLKKNWQR